MREKWNRFVAVGVIAAAFLAGSLYGGGGGQTVRAEAPAAQAQSGGNSTWMTLRINGTQIEGDSAIRKGEIELLSFSQSVTTAREAGSGLATGRRQYQPLLIRKRIDKASPLLMKALTEGGVVDAQFGFVRPNPTGDGTEERFYEIAIRNARVVDIQIVQDGFGPPMEEVSFVFQRISWTYTNGGVTHEDTWSQQR